MKQKGKIIHSYLDLVDVIVEVSSITLHEISLWKKRLYKKINYMPIK